MSALRRRRSDVMRTVLALALDLAGHDRRESSATARSARRRRGMSISTTVLPSCAFSAAGVSFAITRPPSTTAMRSASRSASSRYCVVSSTVVPSLTSSRIMSHSSLRLVRSRPVVGSSRNSTGGLVHQRGRDVQATAHAARVGPQRPVGGVGELEPIQQLRPRAA